MTAAVHQTWTVTRVNIKAGDHPIGLCSPLGMDCGMPIAIIRMRSSLPRPGKLCDRQAETPHKSRPICTGLSRASLKLPSSERLTASRSSRPRRPTLSPHWGCQPPSARERCGSCMTVSQARMH